MPSCDKSGSILSGSCHGKAVEFQSSRMQVSEGDSEPLKELFAEWLSVLWYQLGPSWDRDQYTIVQCSIVLWTNFQRQIRWEWWWHVFNTRSGCSRCQSHQWQDISLDIPDISWDIIIRIHKGETSEQVTFNSAPNMLGKPWLPFSRTSPLLECHCGCQQWVSPAVPPTCVRCLIWDPLEMTFQPTRQPILILFVTHHSFCPFSWHWHGWVCDFPTLSMRPFERSYALELVWRSGRQAMDGWMGKNLFHSAALSCWALSFHLSVWCRSRMPTLSSACDCFGMCALTYGCLHSKNDEQWASTIRFVVQGVAFFSPFQRSKGEVPVQCRSRSSISRFHFPYWSFAFLFSKSTLLCLP